MSDPQKSNHWDLLADQLGAKAASEGPEGESTAPDEPIDVTPKAEICDSPAPEANAPEPPPKKPSKRFRPPGPNWDALAAELGVVTKPSPGEPGPAETPPDKPADTPERVEADREPAELNGSLAEALVESVPDAADEAAEVTEGPGQPFLEEAGTLAEDPAMIAAESRERKPPRRRRKRHRKTPKPEEAARDAVALADSDSPPPDAAVSRPAAEGERERESAKRRRQRRPSRKKKKGGESEEAVAEQAAPPASAGGGPQEEPSPATPPGAPKPVRPPAHPADEETSAGSRKPSHRGIPTWDEAIGLIISANLESRAKTPGGGASRGRNRPRGSAKARGSGGTQTSKEGRGSGKRSKRKG